ncbi:MAG: hypothetical protein ABIZ80_06665 [Bryobacteraceae bacterium]
MPRPQCHCEYDSALLGYHGRLILLTLLLLLTASLPAQQVRLRLLSEFQRVDPFGEILPADRALVPREIISPATPRNSFFSYHVAITTPPKESYFLAVQMYPPNAFAFRLFEERFVRRGDRWIPDTLEEARYPYFGAMPDPREDIPGQTTRVYLLDVWVPPERSIGRVRLEVLAKVGYWRIAPMEVRVLPARTPDLHSLLFDRDLPDLDQPADAATWLPLADFPAGAPGAAAAGANPPLSVRAAIRRNAAQDIALAQTLEPRTVRPEIFRRVWSAITDPLAGAQWYLQIRDFLYRAASL